MRKYLNKINTVGCNVHLYKVSINNKLRRAMQLKVYKTVIRPVMLHTAEVMCLGLGTGEEK